MAGARRRRRARGTLVYAYEEAIGHCVDPAAVRDKDGISAAVLACDLVAALRAQGRTVLDALDELARRHGVHTTAAVTRRVADPDEAAATDAAGCAPPRRNGWPGSRRGPTSDVTDALVFTGGDDAPSVRVVARPSGTEPKLKSYIEVRCADRRLDAARRGPRGGARRRCVAAVQRGAGSQRGPNWRSPASPRPGTM